MSLKSFLGISTEKFIKEFGIFLIIAGLATLVLETKAFVEKAAKLIFTHSEYLKHMSKENKKKFFSEVIQNTYNFSDYDIESSFSDMAVETFFPVFEDSYKRNYSIYREFENISTSKHLSKFFNKINIKNADKIRKELESPWGNANQDFFVYERRQWIEHMSRKQDLIKDSVEKGFVFINYEHLLQRMFYFFFEISASKLSSDDSEKDLAYTMLRRVKFYINPEKLQNKTLKDLAEEFKQTIKYRDGIEYDAKSFGKKVEKFLLPIFQCIIYDEKGNSTILTPEFKINFLDKTIKLNFKNAGLSFFSAKININKKQFSFDAPFQLHDVKKGDKYKFAQRILQFEMYEEGSAFGAGKDIVKNVDIEIMFPDLKDKEQVIYETCTFAMTGKSPVFPSMKSSSVRNKIFYQHKGWMTKGHGFSLWYKIVKDKF